MSIAFDELRYSMESLELRDELVRHFHERLRQMVLERVAAAGREVVMEEDVKACAEDAFRQAIAVMGIPDGTTQEESGVEFER